MQQKSSQKIEMQMQLAKLSWNSLFSGLNLQPFRLILGSAMQRYENPAQIRGTKNVGNKTEKMAM